MSDALDQWCRANWDKIPDLIRQDCLNELRAQVPRDVLAAWKVQHAAGLRIGDDDPMFHLRTGMVVRNILRQQLLDEELPPVAYYYDSEGRPMHREGKLPVGGFKVIEAKNWDDYYTGALQELCETS